MRAKVTDLPQWKALEEHYKTVLTRVDLHTLFRQDDLRVKDFSVELDGLLFDYSKHLANRDTMKKLIALAEACGVKEAIGEMFGGERINTTENRAVLHVALRNTSGRSFSVETDEGPKPVNGKVEAVLEKMKVFAGKMRNGEWTGSTGATIKNIVNIGIGGSDLGPAMAYKALTHYCRLDPDREYNLTVRFLSNIDGTDFTETVKGLNAEETLFIISSKSFKTTETLTNAHTAKDWFKEELGADFDVAKHFVAVSTAEKLVKKFGITDTENNMFEFWDWVGGRYSLPSAIGLSLMTAIGPEHFHALHEGYHEIDNHFTSAPFEKNIPVIMALLGILYNNFFDYHTYAVLPYDQYLSRFPAYLQQLDMESNGKRVSKDNEEIEWRTGPVVWGEPGTNGQHAFYQLIHQGKEIIPVDFIAFAQTHNPKGNHHKQLLSNVFAQSEALAFGKTIEEVKKEDASIGDGLALHKVFPGNRPSTIILAEKLDPRTLGKLIALYEHKIFVQGVIWNINSFDQWGVQLGKKLAEKVLPDLEKEKEPKLQHHKSTNRLITWYRGHRGAQD